ncbi:MAG: NAD-dependent epimerase/dehydratase family protein [Acidimicrobiales bacterium]
MKIVVTGGAGFIGANLCRHLQANDTIDEIVVVDDLSNGDFANLDGLDVEFHKTDVCSGEDLDVAFAGAAAVVHLAALGSVPRSMIDPAATLRANTTGTLSVLEAARRAAGAHVVFASSSSVYGATSVSPKHEDLPSRPISPYGASKAAAESLVLSYGHAFALPTTAFRFFNVFGPLQASDHIYAAAIPLFVEAALRYQPLVIHGDGLQSRDFTFVDTVCEVLTTTVVDRVTSPGPVNLAFGRPVTLLEVVAAIEERLGVRVEVQHGPQRPADIRHSCADWSKLHDLFPHVEPTPFEEGLSATIDWFLSR